jgi:hypothetical protein
VIVLIDDPRISSRLAFGLETDAFVDFPSLSLLPVVSSILCCLPVDPGYLASHPEEASLLNAPPAPRQTVPLNTSELVFGGNARRRLSQLSPNPSLSGGNITDLYWNQFGENDRQRFTNLATALSRSIDTWTIDSCLAKYTISSSRNGPRMLGFFCAYFGGPPTLPGCSFQVNGTNTTYTSADIEGLQVNCGHFL